VLSNFGIQVYQDLTPHSLRRKPFPVSKTVIRLTLGCSRMNGTELLGWDFSLIW
jgi:hypothetical protein